LILDVNQLPAKPPRSAILAEDGERSLLIVAISVQTGWRDTLS
jgi:hypothetical protein